MKNSINELLRKEAEAVLNGTTSAFFRFSPPDGRLLLRRSQTTKPSSGFKMPLRESDAHPFSARGIWNFLIPNTAPLFWTGRSGKQLLS